MPTYEYECTACGQHIEVFQRISEDPLTVCGACGGLLRKVFHPAGIVFRGSGFYATDSRSGTAAASKGDREGGSSDGGKDGAPSSSSASPADGKGSTTASETGGS